MYAVDSTKDGDVTKNSFHYDINNIPGGERRQVTRAQLELGNGVYYPLTNGAGGVNLILQLNKYNLFAASQNLVHTTG